MKSSFKRALPGVVLALLLFGVDGARASQPNDFNFADQTPSGNTDSGASISAKRPVIARVGTPSNRPAGLPSTSEPARQIESARMVQSLEDGFVEATVTLRAAATAATDSALIFEWGRQQGTVCQGEKSIAVNTDPGSISFADYNGRSVTVKRHGSEILDAPWNCAFVVLAASDGPATYDAVIGPLKDVLAPPVPKLRMAMKDEIQLKPGRWAKVRIRVSNPGTGPVKKATLQLRAKRLRVKLGTKKLGNIPPGKSRTRVARVRLTSKKQGTLRVTARGGKLRANRTLTVAPNLPAGPTTQGKYKGTTGDSVTFEITPGGFVSGFSIFIPVRCGAFPDIPLTTSGYYDFPRTKIRNGKIDAVDKGNLYTATLKLTVNGTRVKDGYFSYNGPNYCTGTGNFTAKKTG